MTTKAHSRRILETVQMGPDFAADREHAVIRDVRILGAKSRNGRTYSDAALTQAVGLYEGVVVNIDHEFSPGDRRVADGWGELRGVYRKGDAVHGDLHYLKAHPLTEMILERAERFPDKIGLSHDAQGEMEDQRGELVVAELTKVRSVDVVANPATNTSLFESEHKAMPKTVREVAASAKREGLRTLLEMAMDADPAMGDVPVQMAEMGDKAQAMDLDEMTEKDQVKMAFRSLIDSVLNDENLDTAAKLKKLRDLLKMEDNAKSVVADGGSNGGGSSEASEEEDEKEMEEGKKYESLRNEIEQLKRLVESQTAESTLAKLLTQHGLAAGDLSDAQRRVLESERDPQRISDLLEAMQVAPRTSSRGPWTVPSQRRNDAPLSESYAELRKQHPLT